MKIQTPDGKVIEIKPKSDTTKVGEFINCILLAAPIIHAMHLRVSGSGAYAAHKALNELYEALPEHADDLAEKWQGFNGALLEYPVMDIKPFYNMQPIEFVTWLLNYVNEYRSVFGNNTSLQNMVDELLADIASTKYKLTFLK